MELLKAKNLQGERAIPSSQLHFLQSGLYHGDLEAKLRYQLIEHRYPELAAKRSVIFFKEENKSYTRLLDSLEIMELWGSTV